MQKFRSGVHAGLFMLLTLPFVCPSTCPTFNLQANFDLQKFQGTWYQMEYVPSVHNQFVACVSSNFTLEGNKYFVIGTGRNADQKFMDIQSGLDIPDLSNPAHMIADHIPFVNPPYDVVSTDYTSYACIHSCVDIGPFRVELMFINSRMRTLAQDKIDSCKRLYQEHGVDVQQMTKTHQENCT